MKSLSCRTKTTSISLLILFTMTGCVDWFFEKKRMSCPVFAGNRTASALRFVAIISGTTTNEFGYLGGSKTTGKTSLGCEVELVPDLKIEWEEGNKKYTATVDTAKYIPKWREIKSFSFLYQGNGKWDVYARSDIYDDSPEVKP
jgi:hypothetical protein